MNDLRDRIPPEPPGEALRDRLERRLFDAEGNLRVALSDATGPRELRPRRPVKRLVPALALLTAAGATAGALWLALHRHGARPGPGLEGPGPQAKNTAPSLVVTPPGGATRLTLGDAVVDVAGDTALAVIDGADGGLTLELRRGTVDCEVAPRDGRAPFVVVAGEVTVTVVGTRFAVARDATGVRVDVTHGVVRVTAGAAVGGEVRLGAGETWRSAETPEAGTGTETGTDTGTGTGTEAGTETGTVAKVSAAEEFRAAQALEGSDAAGAARRYRALADGRGLWAATALYALAQLDEGRGRHQAALADVDEYQRRFPRGANAEDAAWLRVEILRAAGRRDEATRAARGYLTRFPSGTYADAARPLAGP